ncbi:unnamed protein product [Darwinula stevensoni]|uniref:Mitochondrial import inner membrane translocase subunit n=1 Tax=Darwinula stevensoni TaxID=69355 RepID=A0A7R9A9M7_9CRUS|nr:unnamed protein product [Darwinula stevensoni]CAG0897591.1 unnamed protein product [Darwinula stevensoni]
MSLDESSIPAKEQVDRELQQFLLVQQQRAQFHAQVQLLRLLLIWGLARGYTYVFFQVMKLHEMCWDLCTEGKMSSKTDAKTETCFSNCADRFIDVNLTITQRFAQLLQKSSGGF